MRGTASYFKLGLLVIALLGAIVVTAFGLGVHFVQKDTVEYRTYFEESIQGLDVGAPVQFRGVRIGAVSGISVAPDRRHIEVVYALARDDAARVGLDPRSPLPQELRAQLTFLGLTGVRIVSLDLFDPAAFPAPTLPFAIPRNHIPAAPSLLRAVERAALSAGDKVPVISDALVRTLMRVDHLLAGLEDEDVSERMADTLHAANRVLGDLDRTLRSIDRAAIPARSARTLDEVNRSVAAMNALLERMDGDDGFVASATRAAEVVGELGRGSDRTTRELESTMRGLREAADSIRALADALERDPEMLLKGRRQ